MNSLPLAIALVTGLVAPSFAHADVAADVAASNVSFAAALNSGDAAAAAAHFTANAVLMPPDMVRASGTEAITAVWQAFVKAGVKGLKVTTESIDTFGDHALEAGTYQVTVPVKDGKSVTQVGKYLVEWKLDDGKWLMFRDIWNADPQK